MTATPDDREPGRPGQPAVDASGPASLASNEDGLTAAELAELSGEQWDAGDPEFGPAELPASEWARLQAEDDQWLDELQRRPDGVPEAFDAGFSRHCGGKPGNGFAAGGRLDVMRPGSDLAWHVGQARRDLAGLDDDQLTGVMIAGQKTEAWAAEVKLAAAAELDRRRTARDGQDRQKASEEIGAALTLTPRSADILAGVAGELARLPQIQALLAHGIIGQPRVSVITRHTSPLPDEEAAAVEDVIARRAGDLNTGRLAAACDTAVRSAGPAAAKRRKEQALRNARVQAWTEPDGTAALAGRDLPPAQVIAATKNLDADARSGRRYTSTYDPYPI